MFTKNFITLDDLRRRHDLELFDFYNILIREEIDLYWKIPRDTIHYKVKNTQLIEQILKQLWARYAPAVGYNFHYNLKAYSLNTVNISSSNNEDNNLVNIKDDGTENSIHDALEDNVLFAKLPISPTTLKAKFTYSYKHSALGSTFPMSDLSKITNFHQNEFNKSAQYKLNNKPKYWYKDHNGDIQSIPVGTTILSTEQTTFTVPNSDTYLLGTNETINSVYTDPITASDEIIVEDSINWTLNPINKIFENKVIHIPAFQTVIQCSSIQAAEMNDISHPDYFFVITKYPQPVNDMCRFPVMVIEPMEVNLADLYVKRDQESLFVTKEEFTGDEYYLPLPIKVLVKIANSQGKICLPGKNKTIALQDIENFLKKEVLYPYNTNYSEKGNKKRLDILLKLLREYKKRALVRDDGTLNIHFSKILKDICIFYSKNNNSIHKDFKNAFTDFTKLEEKILPEGDCKWLSVVFKIKSAKY